MLRNSPPPDVQIDPDAQKRAEAKVQLLQAASKEGRPYTLHLDEGELSGYVLFDLLGKDQSLVLEGRLVVENGYLRLQPESGTLGTLPLPQSSLKGAVARLFDRPENRETFHVPPGIRDIRVEHGELIVVRR